MSTNPEYAVIGSALANPDIIPFVLQSLRPDDFSDDFGRLCLEELQKNPVREKEEIVTLEHQLKKRGIDGAGPALSEAIRLAFPSKIEAYCRIVREESVKRKLAEIALESNGRSIQDMRACITELFENCDIKPAFKNREEALKEWMEHYDREKLNPGGCLCPTGYPKLDECLGGGMVNGGLYIIGARPGVGKTTFVLNMADRISNRGEAVLFVSLEMSSVQITSKNIAIESGVGYTRLLNATVTKGQYETAINKCDEMLNKPFYIMDASPVTLPEIEAAARQCPELKCIFIDYLGLIDPSDRKGGIYEQVTQTSRELKQMAKRLDIPVVCLCQLNRNSMQQADKRPKLSDLRDSGAIEQDADAVLLLYRQDYFMQGSDYIRNEDSQSLLEAAVAKNRHGEAGKTVHMTWYGRSGTVVEIG